jgi:Zn-dependent peptidase ImmA (M78 family)
VKDSIWTKDRVRELKKRFPREDTQLLALYMGISYQALKKKASRLGLKKSRAYMRALGRA